MSKLQLIRNRIETAHVRRARFQGREHYVVPSVMLKEQVLNCDGCAPEGEFVPADEIAASAPGWPGRPVTLSHPKDGDTPISANDPGTLERYQVGQVFNSGVAEDGTLKGEAWIDIELAKKVLRGNRLLERIEKGEMLEVSTGYFRNAEKKKGTHNNKNYGLVQRDILPDHFAILLDETGACSINDGCGAPRINAEGDSLNKQLRAIEDAVWKRARAIGEDWWPVEVFEEEVIVQAGPHRLVRMPYTVKDDGTIEFGEPEEVKVKYETVSTNADGAGMVQRLARGLARMMGIEGTANDDGAGGTPRDEPQKGQTNGGNEPAINANSGKESNTMDRAKTISALAANSAVPFDAAQLEAMTDAQLAKLQGLAGNSGAAQGDEPQKPAANDGGCGCKGTTKPAANAGESHSAGNIPADAIAKAVKEVVAAELAPVKDFMASHQAGIAQQKSDLVARLAANERCPFDQAELESFGLATLEKMERSYMPTSYLGLGGPRGLGSNADDAPPAPPAVLHAPVANSNGKED